MTKDNDKLYKEKLKNRNNAEKEYQKRQAVLRKQTYSEVNKIKKKLKEEKIKARLKAKEIYANDKLLQNLKNKRETAFNEFSECCKLFWVN